MIQRPFQSYTVAQILRNQFSIDYYLGTIRELPRMPIFNRKMQTIYKEFETKALLYSNHVRDVLIRKDDTYELLLDGTCEYQRYLKKYIWYYEQAVIRLLMHDNISNPEWLAKISTGRSLLSLCGYLCGCEVKVLPNIRDMLSLGRFVTDYPDMNSNSSVKALPSTMGHLNQVCNRLNLEILTAYGIKEKLFDERISDPEIMRSIDIASEQIQFAMVYYNLMIPLVKGYPLDEALQLAALQDRLDAENTEKEKRKQVIRQANRTFTNTKLTNNK